jgi:hypothetical protein
MNTKLNTNLGALTKASTGTNKQKNEKTSGDASENIIASHAATPPALHTDSGVKIEKEADLQEKLETVTPVPEDKAPTHVPIKPPTPVPAPQRLKIVGAAKIESMDISSGAKGNSARELSFEEKYRRLSTSPSDRIPLLAVIASGMAAQYFTDSYSKMRTRMTDDNVRSTMQEIVRYSKMLVEELVKEGL